MTLRVWILIIFIVLSILAINPNPYAKGIIIKSVQSGSLAEQQGITKGLQIISISHKTVETLADYSNEVKQLENKPLEIEVKTDKNTVRYNITNDIGFYYDDNLTILSSAHPELQQNSKLLEINSIEIKDRNQLNKLIEELIPQKTVIIGTNAGEFAYLAKGPPEITVEKAKTTNIVKGLELEGGTRVLIRPVSDDEITSQEVEDLKQILERRLNVFGISDINLRSATDLAGNRFIVIEIAGATREEVQNLISKQGKFEAKIDDEVVFIGGNKDIPFVCRNDGSCSGITTCNQLSDIWQCQFDFTIRLSQDAAKRHATITNKLDINTTEFGNQVLSKTLDLYLDGKLVDSLQIAASLKGQEATSISISGPGFGSTQQAAFEDATQNMNELQTLLITGSLPLEIKIEKLDSISPLLGQNFIKNAFLVGFLAIIIVSLIAFIRYRKLRIIIPMMITSLSEIIIILGFAALAKWNLDVVSIAGIIATVGTGVDHQIVITDEILRSKEGYYNLKQKIKRAFFIIMAAYATTVVAMIPLWSAGAGLIRGFAFITIIGVTIGVFITRPAYASLMEKLFK